MISIIITAYKEPKTIRRAIESILDQRLEDYEIIVVAPDKATLNEAKKVKNKHIRILKDSGNGKPAALNFAVKRARGEILILTDGDVYTSLDSIKKMMLHFNSDRIGAVSGRPVSIDKKENMMGYWAWVLTNIANERRIRAVRKKLRFFCSGYLFAIRKELFPKLPEELLSEDGYISHKVYEKGYGIAYSHYSKVFVKYPDNIDDWIKQKKRSAGGYNQIKKMLGIEIRSAKSESLGAFSLLKYVNSFKEFYWLMKLFMSRIYLWYVIYKEINVQNKTREELWVRVESTK